MWDTKNAYLVGHRTRLRPSNGLPLRSGAAQDNGQVSSDWQSGTALCRLRSHVTDYTIVVTRLTAISLGVLHRQRCHFVLVTCRWLDWVGL